MNIDVVINNDRIKLKEWLEMVPEDKRPTELKHTINRLEREIAYYKNFHSTDYYQLEDTKPIEIGDQKITSADISKMADNIIKEKEASIKESKKLLEADHTKAVKWMVETRKYLDDEALAYGKPEDYGNIKDELSSFQDMFIGYINELAENVDSHIFYNDEVDEWYFQRRGTDKNFEKPEYFFPCQEFAVSYKGHIWCYSETIGQGTAIGLCVLDEDGINKMCTDYGITRQEFDEKIYVI